MIRIFERAGRVTVEICAECPHLGERNAAVLRLFPGAVLTHGACDPCRARLKTEAKRYWAGIESGDAVFAGKQGVRRG